MTKLGLRLSMAMLIIIINVRSDDHGVACVCFYKMGRRRRTRGVKRTPEQEKKRQALLKKMHSRLGVMKTARSSGASPQVNKAMKMMSREELEGAEDMLKDMKGIKSTNAKKYLKNMMSGMDSDQMDAVSSMVKEKVPEASATVRDHVQRQKRANLEKESKEVQVNPETVYVPHSKRDDAHKSNEKRAKRSKGFKKMEITVPSIGQLNSMKETLPNVPTKKSVEQSSVLPNSLGGIDEMFRVRPSYTPYKDRMKTLSKFSNRALQQAIQSRLLEHGHVDVLRHLIRVETCDPGDYLMVPGTDLEVTTAPFELKPGQVMANKRFCYRRSEDGLTIIQSRNCIRECRDFLNRFQKVTKSLNELVSRRLPREWLYEYLSTLGIVFDNGCLNVYGKEYDDNNDQSISTPQIPFLKLVWSE